MVPSRAAAAYFSRWMFACFCNQHMNFERGALAAEEMMTIARNTLQLVRKVEFASLKCKWKRNIRLG